MLPRLTMEGRVVADPELRFTPAGIAVCTFSIAANDRKKNEAGEWEDSGDPLFIRVTVWRQPGENCAESLAKGDLVVVIGKLQNRKYEDREGNTRFSLEITADTVAASLQFRTIKHGHTRSEHKESRDADPWASPPPSDDEPPF